MDKTTDYIAGYAAGERDGRATGFWEGYAEALKDLGIEESHSDVLMSLKETPDGKN